MVDSTEDSDYEERIAYMERFNRVLSWESCSVILAYLKIYGRMRPNEIQEMIGMGEKSVFRSLRRLIEAGLVEKEEDRSVEDLRQSTFYRATDVAIIDPPLDKEFIQYLIQSDQYEVISEWLQNTNKASMGLVKALTQILKSRLQESKDTQDYTTGKFPLKNSYFYEGIIEVKDPEQLAKSIDSFVKKEFLRDSRKRTEETSPMDKPAGVFLAFMPIE